MSKALITVIIPVYNVERYLERCLKSIITQTYNNIEIILIDDGSTDNCYNICEEYAKIDKRIIIIHKKNEGVSAARNDGLNIAKGEYITFVDADDYVDKEYIEQLYKECESCNSDISIIGTNDINEQGQLINKSRRIKKEWNREEAIKQLMVEKYYTCVIWGKMYKKYLFNNIRFNTNIRIAEDLDVLSKIILKCDKVTINTRMRLYYYEIRNNSAIHKEYGREFKKEIEICQEMIEKISGQYPKIKKYAIRRYIRINITCIVRVMKATNMNENEKDLEIKELKNNIDKYKNLRYFQDYKNKIKVFLIYKNPKMLKRILQIKDSK